MPEDGYRTLYRIVLTNPPTVRDMLSHAALGRQPRDDRPESLRRWHGISLFDTIERARRQARGKPWLGHAFIATLDIPTTRFKVEQTGRRGHYTLWGDAHDILRFVSDVQAV